MKTRIIAAGTTLLLVAGVGLAAPSQATTSTKTKIRNTTTTVTAGTAVAKAKVTLTAAVTPRPGGGTVGFTASGKTVTGCAKVALRTGRATCVTTFPSAGRRTITAAYSGRAKTYRASNARRVITVKAAPTPAPSRAGAIVGGTGSCTTTTGALVAVSFGTWSGPVVRGCDPAPTTGIKLLTTAGFTTKGTSHDGPAFICRIGHTLFNSGTEYPTPAQDACVRTPPASAYWSYWLAAKGTNTWTYSTLGAYANKPVAGQVQAWTFGSTDVNGTTGQPNFTPDQVRAGLSASKAVPAQRRATSTPKVADQDAAVRYLTENLVGGNRNEPFGQPDYGLTIDSALALAATGTADATLARITDFVAKNQNDYTYLSGEYADYVSGGAVGKVALLAEVTGHRPSDFGGVNLIAALKGLICTDAQVTDKLEGCTVAGNYRGNGSVFGQVLGIIAQARAGATGDATAAIDYLESLQLSSGAFPSVIGSTSGAEVDSTAMAAMALDLVGDRAAAAEALAWIAGQQNPDGGFPGAAGNSTNSAALAILALTLGGSKYGDEIADAEAFLAGQQNSDGGFTVSADDGNGSDVRASTQVVSALVGTPFSTLVDDVASPTATQPDADRATKYLVGALADGDHLPGSGGYENYGGTADVALALASSGADDDTLVAVVKYLRAHVADYADPKNASGYGPFGGSVAKLALIAEITGQDPRDFGGFDLLGTLTDTVCTAGDGGACSAPGDFSGAYSGVSQTLGVLVLARAGVDVPTAALTRLAQLQCTDGGFSSELIAPGARCTSDVDTTGFAVQALVPLNTSAARDSVARAVTFLRGAQDDNGSWQGGTVKAESTNSTALAVQGLLAAPASADFPKPTVRAFASRSDLAVEAGSAYLGSRQNGDGGFGISTAAPDSDVRATTQVVPAAAFATFDTLSHPISLETGPGGGSSSASVPSGSPTPSDDGGSSSPVAAGVNGGTADTGVPSQQLIAYALALLLAGGLLAAVGRRRQTVALVATVVGRHRGSHR